MPNNLRLRLCLSTAIFVSLAAISTVTAQPKGLTPEEAVKHLTVAEGLKISLYASEPHVRQPLSISFDDRGRMWVLQYIQYPIPKGLKAVKIDRYLRTQYDRVPLPPPKGPKGNDKISILFDSDGDGRIDASKDFLGGLNLASGMALGHGGVFVVQSPYLLFYADRNGDDVPDGDPEVLLTGFGMDDAHAFANSLTWGPDGWLYGAQGSTVSADIRGVKFQQGVWRYHPTTKQFELFAEGGGNTWGIDFDRHGNLFAGGNTVEPLCHHVQGAYYVKGFGKHGPLHNPYSFGYFRPVKHHGYVGDSLTGGFVIYQGGAFPQRYNGACIAPNTRHSASRSSTIEQRGSTFATRFQGDFITSTDVWFRPIDGLAGPDGSLYVCDWYDYNISHSNPKDRSKWYVPSIEDGRIWKVSAKKAAAHVFPDKPLRTLTSDALVDLLSHPNDWYAREARLILAERRDPSIAPRLERMIFEARDQRAALQALWSLYVSVGIDETRALKLLNHRFEFVRAWTIRLSGDTGKVSRRLSERFVALGRIDPSSVVRSQLACTAKRLQGADALPIVAALLRRDEDADDPHIPLLLWWAIEDKAVSNRRAVLDLLKTAGAWKLPLIRNTIVERLARRYTAEADNGGYAACAELLNRAPSADDAAIVIAGMEQQLAGRRLPAMPAVLKSPIGKLLNCDRADTKLIQLAARMGSDQAYRLAIDRVNHRETAIRDRVSLIHTLGELQRTEAVDVLLNLVGRGEPESIQQAALTALEHYTGEQIGRTVLERYVSLAPKLKNGVLELLTLRKTWSAMLLAAVENKTIDEKQISTDLLRQMLLHNDAELQTRIEKRWGRIRAATPREKQGRIQAVTQILARGQGEAVAGKKLFTKHCAACHQLFGEGNKIGPDLTGAERKNRTLLLENVIDPNAVVRRQYRSYVVLTVDGRVLTGLLAESTPETLTILDAKNKRTLLRRSDIDEMKASNVSLMPEKILEPLSNKELLALFAYLQADKAPANDANLRK